MKKYLPILIATVFLVGIALPAFAVDWGLYGQVRLQTFWTDYSEERPGALSDTTRFSGSRNASLGGSMQATTSRFGGKVEHETIKGGFEVGSGGLTPMNIRLLWAAVKVGPGELLVGQHYAPYGMGAWFSKDVYPHHSGYDTMGLQFVGYTCRVPMVQYSVSGFRFAFTQPDHTFSDDFFSDPERQIPQIQASYDYKIDKTKLNIAAAFQTYKENANVAWKGERLDAWGVTGSISLTQLDPIYINLGGQYGQNLGPLGQFDGIAGRTGAGNVYPELSPAIGPNNKIEDTDTWTVLGTIGFQRPSLGGEIGVGHLSSDNDLWPGEDEMSHYYAQLRIPLTQTGHALCILQVGYYDYHDDNAGNDAGDATYGGAAWQVFF